VRGVAEEKPMREGNEVGEVMREGNDTINVEAWRKENESVQWRAGGRSNNK